MNAAEGTSVSAPQFVSQSEQMNSGVFGGFNFQVNFQVPQSVCLRQKQFLFKHNPGLDGHTRRITPIPVSAVQSQHFVLAMDKLPDEIQKGASELIQRLEKKKLRMRS